MFSDLILYRWRVRDALNPRKTYETRHLMSDDTARRQYGDRLVERIESSREVRTGGGGSAGHVQRSGPACAPIAKTS